MHTVADRQYGIYFVILLSYFLLCNKISLPLSTDALKILEELRSKTKNVSTDPLLQNVPKVFDTNTNPQSDAESNQVKDINLLDSNIIENQSNNSISIKIYSENSEQQTINFSENNFLDKKPPKADDRQLELGENTNKNKSLIQNSTAQSSDNSIKKFFKNPDDTIVKDHENYIKTLETKIQDIRKTITKSTREKSQKLADNNLKVSQEQNVFNNKLVIDNVSGKNNEFRKFDEITDEELIKFAEKHVWSAEKAKKHLPPPTPSTKYSKKVSSKLENISKPENQLVSEKINSKKPVVQQLEQRKSKSETSKSSSKSSNQKEKGNLKSINEKVNNKNKDKVKITQNKDKNDVQNNDKKLTKSETKKEKLNNKNKHNVSNKTLSSPKSSNPTPAGKQNLKKVKSN